MVRTFDASLRLQTLEGKKASGSLQGVLYGCDTAGRLSSVSGNGYSVACSYAANSLLVSGLEMTNGVGGGLVTARVWDKLNRSAGLEPALDERAPPGDRRSPRVLRGVGPGSLPA